MVYISLGLLYAIPADALRLKTNWAQRVNLSEKIVRGQVVEVKSYWNPERTRIYTDVTVLIDEHIKGDGVKEITITIPGGTVGDMTQWVSDTPQFDVGDYGVILLGSSGRVISGPDGVYLLQKSVAGANQLQSVAQDGFLSWIRAYVNGQTQAPFEEVTEEISAPPSQLGTTPAIITGVSPSTISAGTNSVLTVNGSGFGASRGSGEFPTIAFRYKYTNYMYDNSQFISWSDTQIQLYVWTGVVYSYFYSPGSWPDTVAFVNGIGGSVDPTYGLTVPFGYGAAKWSTPPVTYYINPTGGPSGSATAIQAAASTWSGAGPNFSFNYGGTNANGFACNNTIGFGYMDDPTIIGMAQTCYSGGVVTGAGIQFNTHFAWSTDTPPTYMDLQTITLHELGHWLRLLDLYGANDTAKAMYGFGGSGVAKRTLTSEDTAGIQWIYGTTPSDNTPPDTTITGGPSGTITTNSATFTFTGTDNVTSTPNLVYATYLQGYDSGWSSFSSSTTKSYSNLPNGSYTFQVKAKDQAGNEDLTPATRSFTVASPNRCDFNGDGKTDIVWRNSHTGQNYVWYQNGIINIGGDYIDTVADLNWTIVGPK